jgi:CheY-like chemotaxis protein
MEPNNKRVLVVEDHPGLRDLTAIRLINAGYTVYGAVNGFDALEQMEKHSIDVVVTDHHMPKMNGFELLLVCRKKWPGTPVVFLSGDHDNQAEEVVNRGAFAWVRKGSDFLEVLATAAQQSVHA